MALAYVPEADLFDPQQDDIPDLLHSFFVKQARRRPDHPALECKGVSLTYGELDRWTNQIANYLQRRGVSSGGLVALYFSKTPELFAAILGVLKAGAGYVPIDPKFPADRVGSIIEDSCAVAILTEKELAGAVPEQFAEQTIALDAEAETISGEAAEEVLSSGPSPADISYVIFTSGSTGRPKGVMVEHRNAAAFVSTLASVYGVSERDRVYQGFSIAFDAAVEEIWAAWACGGTLVVADEETARSPLDAGKFIVDRRITVVSTVPTFLSLIDRDMPTVRLLIVGGETCPQELVTRWASGSRRMLNTYGPTETTVVATLAELSPDRPVTIGGPLPGYTAHVLNEQMQPVKPGEAGELYIGGAGVARGYINRPDLNAERFLTNPFDATSGEPSRLYRTYDHVRLLENGSIAFLGRLDAQIKIRGFRVELTEIEAVLLEYPTVKSAAVGVVERAGQKELAAYVVPLDEPDAIDRQEIAELLRKKLPDYMVPKYLDVIDEIPAMTSGKVDRRRLPQPKMLLSAGTRKMVPAQTEMEKVIAKVWANSFRCDEVSVEDDFFLDLGGHSLVAAHVVTALREELHAASLSVRELYQHPTVRKLAAHLEKRSAETHHAHQPPEDDRLSSQAVFETLSPWVRWTTVACQAVSIYLFYAVVSAPFIFALVMILQAVGGSITWESALNNVFIISLAAWPAMLSLSIAVKWLVVGRYKPGRYPVWSFYYLRWWVANRFQALSWSEMFVGTPLMSLYYRAMGAKVGRNCVIDTPLCTAFDLVSIGDDSSIGPETQLLGYRVEDGMLVIGGVEIGERCFVGMQCDMGLGCRMENDSRLDDLSALPDGTVIREGEAMQGSPARPAKVHVPEWPEGVRRRSRPMLFGLIHLALIYAMGYFLIFTAVPSLALVSAALIYGGIGWGIAAAFAAVPVGILWYIASTIALKRLVIGRIRPGVFPVESVAYLRHWFTTYLLNNTRDILMPIYATTYFPSYLRALGARIGRNAEISTVMQISPDLLEIGEGSFLADACLIGGQRTYRGVVEIAANRIGKHTFIGNSALVPGGVDIGDNCLVGVLSIPPAEASAKVNGVRWLGSPGFRLPRTQQDIQFDDVRTFHPSKSLQRLRAAIDVVRIVLPGLIGTVGLVAFVTAFVLAYQTLPLWGAVAAAPVIAVALSFLGVAASAGVKKLLIGTFKPIVKPLYSVFVWLNEIVNAVYEGVAAPSLMPLMGTPFIAPGLRMMGCKVGRWAFLETTLVSEFDLVEIGDYAALNLGSTIQTHLFEDRVMKVASLRIGNGCSVGNMAIILYGTEMKDGSWLGPLSLLMKGESLPENSRWHGIPTQPISVQRPNLHIVPKAEVASQS